MSDIYLQITETPTVVTLSAPVVSGALASTVTVANTVTVALDSNSLSALENVTVTVGAAITGTVTVSNFPSTQTIAGTVTANVGNPSAIIGGGYNNLEEFAASGGIPVNVDASFVNNALPISGTVTANLDGNSPIIASQVENGIAGYAADLANDPFPIAGTVTVGNSVTIGSLPAISGTVTANLNDPTNYVISGQINDALFGSDSLITALTNLPISGTVTANINTFPDATTIGEQIAQGFTNYGSFEVAISGTTVVAGTVTANSSNGSLTTRFGSVTTANTAFVTSAVTNANRKYLLIQNITTASNVITVGIGFTPTTTQGIQLFAGAGLTFEGSYIPTGAVNLLSSVTASCYTILEA